MNRTTTLQTLARVPVFAVTILAPAAADELLNEDFNASDGGFIEEATGATPIPSVYNSGAGTWSMEGDDSGPATNTLTSPAIPVSTTAGIQVTFDHRYSIEAEWDGTAIQISVDDGPFRTIPASAFSQNPYTFSPLIGNHALAGGEGFNGDSVGYADGQFITSVADAGGVAAGSTFRIRFLGAWDEGARGTSIPNWEIDSIQVETLPDTDGDGMPDSYEDANSLDKNVDDSANDDDSDHASNLTEYLNRTDPQDDDSDDDGLLDGDETNTGTFVSASDTGTDPLIADTDGDGLSDSIETNTGILVDANDTGTNPHSRDTDDDGISDNSEVVLLTDPNDSENFPDGWVVQNALSSSGLNSIANSRDLFAGKNKISETITVHPLIHFRENASGPFAGGEEAFPVVGTFETDTNDYAILANGHIFINDPGIYTFGFNSDDGGGLYIDGEPVVLADVNRGSTTSLGAVRLAYGNHKVEFIYWERGGGAQTQVFAAREAGDKTTIAFAIADYELLETSYMVPEDTDNDGLEDGWERRFFNDLTQSPSDDFDSDGSDNEEEQARMTDPSDNDTDDDGIADGKENLTGIFVSADQTGTDPLKSDSDDDGLSDGVEDNGGTFVSATQTGTDPNNPDSDADNYKDGLEVAEGSDPNRATSVPVLPTVTVIAGLIGGDLTDPEDDGIEGETIFATGDSPQTAGSNFNWVSITASEEEYFSGFGTATEGAFDIFDNQIGGGAAKWCCGGAPVSATVEFEEEVSLTHFTLTSSNDTPARDPLDFEIQGSNDGINFEAIYTRADDVSLWGPVRDQTVRIDLPVESEPYKFIRYSVTRTGGANHALSEIEYFGSIGKATPLAITAMTYDPSTGAVSLTWNSKNNRIYSVRSSTDLIDFSTDIDDNVISGGDTTTFNFTMPLPAADKLFFRIEENQ